MSALNKLAAVIVALIAFAAGVLVHATSDPDQADWLSFSGALLGSAVTVLGGIAILQWQREAEVGQQTKLLLQLLADVEASCVPYQYANPTALKERLGRSTAQQLEITRAAIRRIHKFRSVFESKTVGQFRADEVLEELEFDDPDLKGWMSAYVMCPDSADFGALNGLAHEQLGRIESARRYLTGG